MLYCSLGGIEIYPVYLMGEKKQHFVIFEGKNDHEHAHIHKYTHMHTHTNLHVHIHIHTQARTYTHTYVPTCMDTHTYS